MSSRMVAPVVVMPDVLSNQALTSENSPPQSTYGSIENTQLKNQAMSRIARPSRVLMSLCRRTKTSGKMPTIIVRMPLSSSGEKDESNPSSAATSADRNMNTAQQISAIPTFLDMTPTFIDPIPVCTKGSGL